MDSSFVIKPVPVVAPRALRDPVSVRGAVETDLVGDKAVTASYGEHKDSREKNDNPQHRSKDGDRPHDHALHDLVADPSSRDVIYRERDVRTSEREHPDHALLRLRAYRPAEPDPALPSDDHADFKA